MLTNEIIKFAAGDTTFYEAAVDNYFHPTAEKAQLLNKAFFAEVERQSHVSHADMADEAWMNHPSVRWAAMSVLDASINAILPSVLTPAFNLFMDIRFVGVGDIVKFRVNPNSLYTVSKGSFRPAC